MDVRARVEGRGEEAREGDTGATRVDASARGAELVAEYRASDVDDAAGRRLVVDRAVPVGSDGAVATRVGRGDGGVARRVREGRRGGKSSRLGASHIARSTSTAPRGRYGSWDAEASPVAARIARRVPRSSAVAAVVDSSALRVRISSKSYRGTRGIVL